jgi:intracellular multiplication protein IcmW
MPDLSSEGVHAHWQAFSDPMIYRVVTFIEGVEKWVLNGQDEFEDALRRLGEALDEVGRIDLQKEDELIELCVFTSCSRALRLLQGLDAAHPGSASKLLGYAEENSVGDDLSAVFLRRNLVFERLRLLGRVLAPERLQLLTNALEDDDA